MPQDLIQSLLSEQIVQQNIVTDVKVTDSTITVYISPLITDQYVRPDWYLRDIFNASDSYREAFEKLATLIFDGWGELSTGFGRVIKFLQEHFRNMATYLRVPNVQRNSLSECTVPALRRIEKISHLLKLIKGLLIMLIYFFTGSTYVLLTSSHPKWEILILPNVTIAQSARRCLSEAQN